jgi:hypothetical protein
MFSVSNIKEWKQEIVKSCKYNVFFTLLPYSVNMIFKNMENIFKSELINLNKLLHLCNQIYLYNR